ncbi:beta-lactamase/transpeptidase-like protein [Bisporella sp. PMI_857]|nr:beta-lactamase/transpeptidase-like protein [Bisporella sp. PMI_857]
MSRPLRLLSLDGGGIRGISALLILESIMEKIRDDEGLDQTPLPCKYFDLIGGTSTGGIIAIMLGRLEMSVDVCIRSYKTVAAKAFIPKRWIYFPAPPTGLYSATSLEDAIKQVLKDQCQEVECLARRLEDLTKAKECIHTDRPFRDGNCCKTVVLAITKDNVDAPPTLFKSYDTKTSFKDCTIWQVARATSAATTFFKSIKCGRDDIQFVDAGFGYNNPCEVLIDEAQRTFSGVDAIHVLSIGTGLGDIVTISDNRISILNALKKMSSCSKQVADRLENEYGESGLYYRFNVDRGLQDVTLADWEKASTISTHTLNYLREQRSRIQKCAKTFATGSLPQLRTIALELPPGTPEEPRTSGREVGLLAVYNKSPESCAVTWTDEAVATSAVAPTLDIDKNGVEWSSLVDQFNDLLEPGNHTQKTMPPQVGLRPKSPIPRKPITLSPWQIDTAGALKEEIQTIQKRSQVPAIAVGVLNYGKTDIFIAGVRKQGNPTPVAQTDIFNISGCTETMTATVLARLIERGAARWTDTIGKVLPEFAGEIHPAHKNTTIEMFAAHLSGITEPITSIEQGRIWSYLYFSIDGSEGRRATMLYYMRRPPDTTPGEYHWSFFNHMLLALVIERLSEMPWEQAMKTELFDPLEMYHTGFGLVDRLRNSHSSVPTQPWPHSYQDLESGSRLVTPLDPADKGVCNPTALQPVDGIHSSLPDLCKFLRLHLEAQMGISKSNLLGMESFEKLHSVVPGTEVTPGGWRTAARTWANGGGSIYKMFERGICSGILAGAPCREGIDLHRQCCWKLRK